VSGINSGSAATPTILKIGEDCAVLLGCVVVEWSELENQHEIFLGLLKRNQDVRFRERRGSKPFIVKQQQLVDAAKICFGDRDTLTIKIADFCSKIDRLSRQRNLLVHGIWVTKEGDSCVLLDQFDDLRMGHDVKYSVKAEEIRDLIFDIKNYRQKLLELLVSAMPHHPARLDFCPPWLTSQEVSALKALWLSNPQHLPIDDKRLGPPQSFRA